MNPYASPSPGATTRKRGSLVLILLLALSLVYVFAQLLLMRLITGVSGQIEGDGERIVAVAVSAALSTAIIFIVNSRWGRGSRLMLGLMAGAAFFCYAYLITPVGSRVALLLSTLSHSPSLINMLVSSLMPAVLGALLRLRGEIDASNQLG